MNRTPSGRSVLIATGRFVVVSARPRPAHSDGSGAAMRGRSSAHHHRHLIDWSLALGSHKVFFATRNPAATAGSERDGPEHRTVPRMRVGCEDSIWRGDGWDDLSAVRYKDRAIWG